MQYTVRPIIPPVRCPAGENPIHFVRPQAVLNWLYPGMTLGLPEGALEAAHQRRAAGSTEYLNNSYLGSTNGRHEMLITPETGWHSLYVVDEVGNELAVTFYAERSS